MRLANFRGRRELTVESSRTDRPNTTMSEANRAEIGVGLLGLGTVGQGVVRILEDRAADFEARLGRRLRVVSALVRDPSKPREFVRDGLRVTTDPAAVIGDPAVDVVMEVMGGLEPAGSLIRQALRVGRHVITANKALLADRGEEIFDEARQADRAVCFEAAVGGGIPIIQALRVGLAANRILSISAILNGTCNFILTAMTREGRAYQDVLAEAQRLGYAEADPTLDVDGTDTAHKLAVLVQVAFGQKVTTRQITRRGIDRLEAADIRFAGELGYVVKLLAKARAGADGLELRVSPTLVPKGSQLGDISDAYNAIRVEGDAVGDTLFSGRGAGMMPTASAMVSDLIGLAVDPGFRVRQTAELWRPEDVAMPLVDPDGFRTRAYLRFQIADRPGELAHLARILGDHGISIASVIQHEPMQSQRLQESVPLVIMTHAATSGAMRLALDEIARTARLRADPVFLEVHGHSGS